MSIAKGSTENAETGGRGRKTLQFARANYGMVLDKKIRQIKMCVGA